MFPADIPEKQPALLSLVYTAGFALLALLLVVSLLLHFRRRRLSRGAVVTADLPPEVRERLGVTSTNRGLRAMRWVFVLLALGVFGFHVYWAQYAVESNERFQELSYKDLRNRRLAESTLRGWILDRSGSLDRALALYRRGPDGQIVREYPLDVEMAQLFGSDRGDSGLERSLFGIQSGAAPEALDVVMERDIKQPANLDVRLTIDAELQKEAVVQLRGRHGAVVVLNPQTGGRIGIDTAYEVSCNQYFAQMAIKIGPEKMAEAARLVGISPYGNTTDAIRGRKQPQIWNASAPSVARALAPREATIAVWPGMRPFDLGLVGYGQGYAGQMTPFQMALSASAIANLEGKLMKPKIEYDLVPQAWAQATTPQYAAEMRRIMGLVAGGPSGTATSVFAPVHAQGIITGGKTGTAEKEVPVYDSKTGEPKMQKKVERDRRGNPIREYFVPVMSPEFRIDSWYLSIAPLDNPQLAIAVIVEGGGYGARAAAPIAAALVLKARDLGLLGLPVAAPPQQPGQQQPQPPGANAPRAKPRPRAAPKPPATRNPAANTGQAGRE
ncbi:MAG: hypothetical protein LC802_09495 [Acidobacteria bacterium]|nr:hypothetical protein [Acidobacteriota bacterium]